MTEKIIQKTNNNKITLNSVCEFPNGITLNINLPQLYGCSDKCEQVLYRFTSKIGAKDTISMGIYHLAANMLKPPVTTYMFIKDGNSELSAVEADEAKQFLTVLLDLYLLGMSEPLPFFPEASLKYCANYCKFKNEVSALDIAESTWESNYPGSSLGEGFDPYYRFCFGADFPRDNQSFAIVAKIVYKIFGKFKVNNEADPLLQLDKLLNKCRSVNGLVVELNTNPVPGSPNCGGK
jgi:exonuclease V gamma subunit